LPLIHGWRGFALLAAVVAAAYGALALAGFVWDDQALVVGNRMTGDLANIPRFFAMDLWETSDVASRSGYYRPLMLVSLAADRALWGLSPAGAHLHSLAWHLLGALLFWRLLRALTPPPQALLGAMIFALHPLQSEAVAWVVSRNDLMAAALSFGAALALLDERPSRGRLLGGGALALAALLSKESALLALGLIPLLDLARWSRPRGWRRYAALAVAAAAWAALRASAGITGAPEVPDIGRALLLGRFPEVLALYGRKLFVPWPLTVGDTLEYLSLSWPAVVGGLAAPALLAARTLRRAPRLAAAGWIFAAVTFAPTLLAIAIRGQLGERYLYLPMGGLAVAVAAAAPATRAAAAIGVGLGAAWLAALSARVPEWRDGVSLFAAAAEDSPNGFSFANLAHEYNRAERPDLASRWFAEALRVDPPYQDICPHAIRTPLRRGWRDVAWANARLARERGCATTAEFLGLYAAAAAQSGAWEAAREATGRVGDDLDRRGLVVAAALAIRDEDAVALARLNDLAGVAPGELEGQARRLLAAEAQ